MILKYVNSKGIVFNLEGNNIRVKSGNFHKNSWKAKANKKRIGENIESFEKGAVTYEVTLKLRGNLVERKSILNNLHDAAECDIIQNTPGTVHFDEYYIECFILASDTHASEELSYRTEKVIEIYCPYPFWIRESSITIPTATDPEGDGLYYDYTYDYTYGSSGLSITFENEHFAPCNFKLTAHGPFNTLEFAINGNLYRVNQSCAEGEMLILDTSTRTIVKIDTYGNVWNVFGKQDFTLDNFKQIPPNKNILSYGRAYQIELTLYEERSEPKWSAW